MILIDKEKCTGCGQCIEDCVGGVLTCAEGKARAVRPCIQCGHCTAVCPAAAISIPGYDMKDVEEYEEGTFTVEPDALLHMIKFRRSIRKYRECKIEEEHLASIIQAGRYTATAKNAQSCYFTVVKDNLDYLKRAVWEQIDELTDKKEPVPAELKPYLAFNRRRKENPGDDFLFRNAPSVIYVACENSIDAGLAAQNMELMAVSLGMGMLYNGYLARITESNAELKEWLGLSAPIRICMLAGYPDMKYRRTVPRKEANIIWK